MEKKNGKGKEYNGDGNIKFEGKYLNGKEWDGTRYDEDGNIIYRLTNNINGKGKEYYWYGKSSFEGEYLNGIRNGKGKEFNEDGKLIFECEYLPYSIFLFFLADNFIYFEIMTQSDNFFKF